MSTYHLTVAPSAVIFDVGGVLVESPFVAALRWQSNLDLPDTTLSVFFDEYARMPAPGETPPMWHQVEMGQISVQTFLDNVIPRIRGLVPDDHAIFSLDATQFNVFANAGAHWEMIHKVAELRRGGTAVAILTNNVKEWAAWRNVIPLDMFDLVIDSCEVGLRKPDPRIWELTLEQLSVAANEAVFLDDHPTNVAAAQELGMIGIVVGADISAAVDAIDQVMAK